MLKICNQQLKKNINNNILIFRYNFVDFKYNDNMFAHATELPYDSFKKYSSNNLLKISEDEDSIRIFNRPTIKPKKNKYKVLPNIKRLVLSSVHKGVNYEWYLTTHFPNLELLELSKSFKMTECMRLYLQNSNIIHLIIKSSDVRDLYPLKKGHPLKRIDLCMKNIGKNPYNVLKNCNEITVVEFIGTPEISRETWVNFFRFMSFIPSVEHIVTGYSGNVYYDPSLSKNFIRGEGDILNLHNLVKNVLKRLVSIKGFMLDYETRCFLKKREIQSILSMFPVRPKKNRVIEEVEYDSCPSCQSCIKRKLNTVGEGVKKVKNNNIDSPIYQFMTHPLMERNLIPIILKYIGVIPANKNVFIN